MQYHEKIRYVRTQILPRKLGVNKVTTYDLAELLGVDQSFISYVENAKPGKKEKRFGQETITKLSKLSGLPLEFFLRDDIKTPYELAPTPELAEQLGRYVEYLEVIDAAKEAKLSPEEVMQLIEVAKKYKK